jgi:hypothetical protein
VRAYIDHSAQPMTQHLPQLELAMAHNRSHVRTLLNTSEFELFELSLAANVKSLTHRQLNAKISRTRALRDKYRDLFRRQRLVTRARTGTKSGMSGAANQRTDVKAVVMDEILNRLQKRAQQLDAAKERAAHRVLH